MRPETAHSLNNDTRTAVRKPLSFASKKCTYEKVSPEFQRRLKHQGILIIWCKEKSCFTITTMAIICLHLFLIHCNFPFLHFTWSWLFGRQLRVWQRRNTRAKPKGMAEKLHWTKTEGTIQQRGVREKQTVAEQGNRRSSFVCLWYWQARFFSSQGVKQVQ